MNDTNASPDDPPEGEVRGAQIDLLLVERDRHESQSIESLLPRGPGSAFEVWRVEGVEDALRFLQQKSFDALLLDLDTGEDQGIDALLRAQIAATSLPILVASDEDDDTLSLRSLRLGAQDYIVKSESSRQQVTRTILHAVERHRLLRDLTVARQREHFLATHDALTELPNRFYLEEFLARATSISRRRGSSVAVLFIDLDGFKAVNDTLGHAAGDELLRQTAVRLAACVRRSDLVARLGGDEFVVALPEVDGVEGAIQTARQISELVVRPYEIGARQCHVTPSIGVALHPDDAPDADSLLRFADLAMYEAKQRGPNQIRLHRQGEDSELSDRFQLVNGLREAIARGELSLHYQPQIDLLEGRAVGAEALPRWLHSSEGWVSPRIFIPIAERSGILGPIGDWVLRSACQAALSWEAQLRLTVNVSPVQLGESDYAARCERILDETGMPPDRLELEIAESTLSGAEDVTHDNLMQLRSLGVRVALDDFGTGSSSLSLLRRLPLDGVKLDESLVHASAQQPRDEVIVAGLVQIVRGLGMELTAEGVESLEQLQLLHRLGCSRVQGYLLAKPTPCEDFASLLHEEPWRASLESLD